MVKKILLMLILVLLALSACQTPVEEVEIPLEGEPFALYLLGDPQITGPEIKNYDLDQLPLAAVPLITTENLISYDWDNHGLNMEQNAYLQLLAIFSGGIPSSGVPFVIMAYEEPIYAGAFWMLFSSVSFDGVTILQPLDPAGQTLFITLGYPSADNFTGEDPRGNPRLQQALEDAGKLR